MLRKHLGSKRSAFASSSSSAPNFAVYLGPDHEETPDTHSNDASLSTTGHKSSIPFDKDPYSGKLIAD
jgi:hypothetical protein